MSDTPRQLESRWAADWTPEDSDSAGTTTTLFRNPAALELPYRPARYVRSAVFDAERERERISERTREGLEAARKRGRVGGRPPALSAAQREEVRRIVQYHTESDQGLDREYTSPLFNVRGLFSAL